MGYTFPETPLPSSGYTLEDGYQSLVSEYPSGRSVAQAARQYPLFRASLNYGPWLSEADLQPILLLHRNVRGRAGTFTFFEFQAQQWTKLYVGVGDAGTLTFDLPFKTGSSITYYVAGSSTAGTYSAGTGTDGRDRVTFGSPPASGALIEVTATAQRAATCRFVSDDLAFTRLNSGRATLDVEIKETR